MKSKVKKKYKIVPHIADIRLQLKADGLKHLFEVALQGMDEILKKGFCQKKTKYSKTFEIKIYSFDTSSLLVDFLSDVLTFSHIQKAIFCKVKFTEFNEKNLTAKIKGSAVENFDEDIKAVSYHEADIVKDKKGNYKTNIIFDI
ncbi:archease [Candidatus Daviesbacteria bacterium]|nr:archease [Candidatus Daviesbacteria bacterium]